MLPRKTYLVATVVLLLLALILSLMQGGQGIWTLSIISVLCLSILFIPAILFSLIFLFPLRRFLTNQNHGLKRSFSVIGITVVFVTEFLVITVFLLWLFLPAIDYGFPRDNISISNEIFATLSLRVLIPPSLRPARPNCISQNTQVCEVINYSADDPPFDSSALSWIAYIAVMLLSFPASITTGIFFQRFTRKAQ
jgi:hypothetical protein